MPTEKDELAAGGTGLQDKLDGLRADYARKLPERLQQLDELWRKLLHVKWSTDAFKLLQRLIHNLSGSAATFGYADLHDVAIRLDRLCDGIATEGGLPSSEQREKISALLQTLRARSGIADGQVSPQTAPPDVNEGVVRGASTTRVYLVDDDPHVANYLAEVIGHLGYQVAVFPDAHQMEQRLKDAGPELVIMDIMHARDSEAGLTNVARLRKSGVLSAPVIFISARHDMAARLNAVRAGGDAYLPKPVDVVELSAKIEELLAQERELAARVLLVDDDAEYAKIVQAHLEKAGMRVMVVTNPMDIMEPIDKFSPDAILLDMYMPQCSGLELAQILRQDCKYVSTPIIFLSAEVDTENHMEAMRLGGDDFIVKPVEPEQFVALVESRIRRCRSLSRRMRLLSDTDQETGLHNRHHLMGALRKAISTAASGTGDSALLYIELDSYAAIREKLGAEACDRVVNTLASAVEETLQGQGMLARFADDTLAVVLDHTSDAATLAAAEDIRKQIEQQLCEVAGAAVSTTCSIGVAIVDQNSHDVHRVAYHANLASEIARAKGGNGVHLHDPVSDEGASLKADERCLRQLKDALQNDDFYLVYQPVVNLSGDHQEKYEVLLRLNDGSGKEVLPGKFMSVAEQHGLMPAIDRWVLAHAIGHLQGRLQDGMHTTFFIKISAASLDDVAMLPWFDQTMRNSGLPANSIVVEIAENLARERMSAAVAFANVAHQVHCGVAIEHFGVGLNSSQLLEHMPADFVKIDGSYMHDLATNSANQATVKTLTDAARVAGVLTIAEFVEDPNSLAVLWNCGVNYMQGHFLQAPAEELSYSFAMEAE